MNDTAAPAASPRSHLFQLVQAKLPGIDLDQYISDLRAETPPAPYYKIARDLTNTTGVDVTHEAVRRWHLNNQQAEQPGPADPVTPGHDTPPV